MPLSYLGLDLLFFEYFCMTNSEEILNKKLQSF